MDFRGTQLKLRQSLRRETSFPKQDPLLQNENPFGIHLQAQERQKSYVIPLKRRRPCIEEAAQGKG